MSDFERLLRILDEREPVCERCMAVLANLGLGEVSTALIAIRGHIALIAEYEACRECHQWTRTYSFDR